MNLWLIGTGPHAREYSKVLSSLEIDYEVIGRGEKSSSEFLNITKKNVLSRNLLEALKSLSSPEKAIVSVSFDQLAIVTLNLIRNGVKKILIEKPGGLNFSEINEIQEEASLYNSNVYIGYNRRFYASTLTALKGIVEDGGVLSCHFEFTEWGSTIVDWNVSPIVKSHLLIANSSHVLDLAFYLCGKPKTWKCFHNGTIPWHKSSARFSGAGETENGVLFSYISDWEAPGRWGVEIMTRKNRYIFRPMEKLHMIRSGSISIENIDIDNELDKNFKPGLYNQTLAFLKNDFSKLCSLEDQVKMISFYSEMAGYTG